MVHTIEELKVLMAECQKEYKNKVENQNKKMILVCRDTGCISNGANEIYTYLEKTIKELKLTDKVGIDFTGCFGYCAQGPYIKIYPDNTLYRIPNVMAIKEIIEEDIVKGNLVEKYLYVDNLTGRGVRNHSEIKHNDRTKRIALHGVGLVNPENIKESVALGSYQGLLNIFENKYTPRDVVEMMKKALLRGRGGGGFPTGRKWEFALNQNSDEKYVICNADEGDPGAFMDRSVMEGNPMSVIEGMAIAGYAIGANKGYVYIRAEYPIAVKRVQKAIDDCRNLGLLGDNILGTDFSFDIEIRLGAGAFVCGEETALLNSIEGQRGMPRPKPPFPAVKGLWGKPTIINNVETLASIPWIYRHPIEEFLSIGTEKSPGTKVFALGGKIKNVGPIEVPMGMTLRELIYDIGGGIPDNKKFKALQTGGPSGGCLIESELDTPIDFDNLIAKGSMMGSGGAIVMDEDNCMVDVAKFYMQFILEESCGKCTSCRIGTKRIYEILQRITDGEGKLEDLDELRSLGQYLKDTALCGLGQTAANPVLSTMEKFEDEYIAHIVDKKCPAKVCKKLIRYVIDENKCKGCSICKKHCSVNAISGEPRLIHSIDVDKCVRCGVCIKSCPFHAIELK